MKKIHFRKAVAVLLACFLMFTGTKAANSTVDAASVSASVTTTSTTVKTTTDRTTSTPKFTPPDLSRYKLWNGTEQFKEYTNYYIKGKVDITPGRVFTLPANSRLYIADGASLNIYIGSKLTIGGGFTVAPLGSVTSSGRLVVSESGGIYNYGTFSTTNRCALELSAKFTSYTNSSVIFGGIVNVYKSGQYLNYGRTTLHENAVMNLTGVVRSFEGSYLFINGEANITLSGRMALAGTASLTGKLSTSGTLTIEKTADFRIDPAATMEKLKSGRYDDYRKKSYAIINKQFYTTRRGIDVSAWQGVIDWEKVAKAGVDFAIIRSSYSVDHVDKMFEYNITEAKKAGIKVGVYHYCYALTVEEAREEARFFIETVSPYEIDFPLMFDFEDNSQIELGKAKLTEMAEAFLGELEAAGYYPMIYSYKNWLDNYLDMDKLSKYDVAVAQWDVAAPTYEGDFELWQYSCKGLVSGIDGDVDLDISYKDYSWIISHGDYKNTKPNTN